MGSKRLHIKNMVCNRCISTVREEIENLGFSVETVELGEVVLHDEIDSAAVDKIGKVLADNGFELIIDKRSELVNRIKTLIIEYVHYDKNVPAYLNLSDILSSELKHDYSYLSHLFSTVEGKTIERYLILQKVEKIKELIVYDELSLKEISNRLDYSSVGHLSRQFKSVTGLTPSHYKNIGEEKRKSLDQV